MPKKTFNKLDENKKKRIIEAFLKEFSIHIYDEASISRVVKELGIAKGSIYQYFNDKLDLFMFLQEYCGKVKMKFIGEIHRKDYQDFWSYFRALYERGLEFDKAHGLESNFLHSLLNHLESPSIKPMYRMWLDAILAEMRKWIAQEVELGNFRTDVSIDSMAFMIHNTSISIYEFMKIKFGVNINENLQKGISVYAHQNKDRLMSIVDENIKLLSKAFNK